VRRGEYLGHGKEFEREFVPSRASLFAHVPYKVGPVTLTGPGAPVKPGTVVPFAVTLACSSGSPARHWVHVTVRGPDGAERTHYRANVALVGGRGTVHVPLAFNDPPGRWRVRAREIISHASAEATMVVEKGGAP